MRKTVSIFLSLAALLLHGRTINACDCGYAGNFFKVAPKTDLVIIGKVVRFTSYININDEGTPYSMEVSVATCFRGAIKERTIIVYGDDGNLCRPYLSIFTPGETYAFALYKLPEGGYELSACGEFCLKANTKNSLLFVGRTNKLYTYSAIDSFFKK